MSLNVVRDAVERVVIREYQDPFDSELDAFRKELARISFSGFRIPIRLSARRLTLDVLIVDLEMQVYDRDDPSKEIPIRSITTFYDVRVISRDPCVLHERIYRTILGALRHELDEHFKIDGVRVRDPHAGESP
jgi:hypothetical protein